MAVIDKKTGKIETITQLESLPAWDGMATYGGKVFIRGGGRGFSSKTETVFHDGAARNVATFHSGITGGSFQNATVSRAVDGHLTAILGREAAARRTRLTMEDLIKENRRLEADLKGLKA